MARRAVLRERDLRLTIHRARAAQARPSTIPSQRHPMAHADLPTDADTVWPAGTPARLAQDLACIHRSVGEACGPDVHTLLEMDTDGHLEAFALSAQDTPHRPTPIQRAYVAPLTHTGIGATPHHVPLRTGHRILPVRAALHRAGPALHALWSCLAPSQDRGARFLLAGPADAPRLLSLQSPFHSGAPHQALGAEVTPLPILPTLERLWALCIKAQERPPAAPVLAGTLLSPLGLAGPHDAREALALFGAMERWTAAAPTRVAVPLHQRPNADTALFTTHLPHAFDRLGKALGAMRALAGDPAFAFASRHRMGKGPRLDRFHVEPAITGLDETLSAAQRDRAARLLDALGDALVAALPSLFHPRSVALGAPPTLVRPPTGAPDASGNVLLVVAGMSLELPAFSLSHLEKLLPWADSDTPLQWAIAGRAHGRDRTLLFPGATAEEAVARALRHARFLYKAAPRSQQAHNAPWTPMVDGHVWAHPLHDAGLPLHL